jgi:hypothetical protein
MKVDFTWQIFEKCSDINFMKICPVGAEFYVVRQKYDEASSCFLQFCEYTKN